jgi:hypothetical protein
VREVLVAGLATPAVPANAAAVSANLTATATGGEGWATAWPKGTGKPGTSSLNWVAPGQTIANAAIARIGSGGIVNLGVNTLNGSSAHLLLDVNGYFTP